MDGPVIEARGLVKRYGDLAAVDGIDLSVARGESFALLGPNGAGKTTTIRMLYGFVPRTAGMLRIAGLDVAERPRAVRALLGVLPQESNLDYDLTPRENLLAYARYFEIAAGEARRRADELLAFVGLQDRGGDRLDELSGGMKRRLMIARALLNRPQVLILDEPTTGLDPQARHHIWQRLRELKATGTTLFLTTHYMDEARELCDRVAIMDRGTLLRMGHPQRLVEAEVGSEVVEVRAPAPVEAEACRRVDGILHRTERSADTLYLYCEDGRAVLAALADLPLPYVHRRGTSLEDLFFRLTGRGLQE
jgi:lipooligosaccharide transport system ATP-binding protein